MVNLSKPDPIGTVSLTKGDHVDLAKSASGEFIVTGTWQDKVVSSGIFTKKTKTKPLDYDTFGHVVYTDGTEEVVYYGNLVSRNGSVRHHGDLTSGGTEKITVVLTPDIAAVGFSLYSALENGVGSFADARAAVSIDNGAGSRVELNVRDMSVHANRYTLYFGTILNGGAEAVRVVAHEDYSAPGCERRAVLYQDGTHRMDAGIENRRK